MAVAHQERPAYPFDGDPRLQEEVYSAVQGSDERKEERIRTAVWAVILERLSGGFEKKG